MKLEKCHGCNVLKDGSGNARCPYCKGALVKTYPSGRKCIDCENTFPKCKCEDKKNNGGCGSCGGCNP